MHSKECNNMYEPELECKLCSCLRFVQTLNHECRNNSRCGGLCSTIYIVASCSTAHLCMCTCAFGAVCSLVLRHLNSFLQTFFLTIFTLFFVDIRWGDLCLRSSRNNLKLSQKNVSLKTRTGIVLLTFYTKYCIFVCYMATDYYQAQWIRWRLMLSGMKWINNARKLLVFSATNIKLRLRHQPNLHWTIFGIDICNGIQTISLILSSPWGSNNY